jgi:hypothetical protein
MSRLDRALVGVLASFAATLVAARVAVAAPYPDYFGPDVSFTGIEEFISSTQGPRKQFLGAPAGVQNQLLFSPTSAVVSAIWADHGDQNSPNFVEARLQVLLTARNPGGTLDAVLIDESGEIGFFFGSQPGTGASGNLFGSLTVTETLSGPIAPLTINFSAPGFGASYPGQPQNQPWSTSVLIDIESVVPDATEATLSLTNQLFAFAATTCPPNLSCLSAVDFSVQAASIAVIPEPGTFGLMGVGLIGLAIGARRGSRPCRS